MKAQKRERKYNTREEWLTVAADLLAQELEMHTDLEPAQDVLVSVGLPLRERGGAVVGQCFVKDSGEGSNHIFISPRMDNPIDVLATLLHELIHAADDCESSHGGAFRRAYRALGYVSKPTVAVPADTTCSDDLKGRLIEHAKVLGEYPHRPLSPATKVKKQTTRMRKIECETCGYTCRTTQKWIDVGVPNCPVCGVEMGVEEK